MTGFVSLYRNSEVIPFVESHNIIVGAGVLLYSLTAKTDLFVSKISDIRILSPEGSVLGTVPVTSANLLSENDLEGSFVLTATIPDVEFADSYIGAFQTLINNYVYSTYQLEEPIYKDSITQILINWTFNSN